MSPTEHLETLLPAEAALYTDLVEHVLGPAVRLEQERLSSSAVEEAACEYSTATARIASGPAQPVHKPSHLEE
jgi:hypothetical protein